MKPVNTKSLIHFVFDQMDKLDKKEIDVQTAKAQSDLAKQINNVLKYELDRAKVQISLSEHNKNFNNKIELREIELKDF
jgi:hypothetical protein